jgi:hypothetical protein
VVSRPADEGWGTRSVPVAGVMKYSQADTRTFLIHSVWTRVWISCFGEERLREVSGAGYA